MAPALSRLAFPELNKQRLGASPTFLQTWNFPRPVNAPLVCFILLLSFALFREEEKKKKQQQNTKTKKKKRKTTTQASKNALERLCGSGDGGE